MYAAAMKMKAGPNNGKVYTEEDWNTESGPDKEGGYLYSKVGYLLMMPCFTRSLCILPVAPVCCEHVVGSLGHPRP